MFNNVSKLPPCSWGKLVHQTYFSPSIQQEIGYNIYIPPLNEVNNNKVGLIIWFHGANGNENSDVGMSWHFFKKMQAKQLNPFIILFPNGFERSYWHNNYDCKTHQININAYDTLAYELLPDIYRQFPFLTQAKNKATIGFSMGAHGALQFNFLNPEFISTITIDGGIWYYGNESSEFINSCNCDATEIETYNIFSLAKQSLPQIKNKRFYMLTSEMGVEDHRLLQQFFESNHIESKLEVFPDLPHSTVDFFKLRFKEMCQFLNNPDFNAAPVEKKSTIQQFFNRLFNR